ncbi:AAA family ATPase [Clostridium swellfunianum]|uniref:AAA family ATPase n=1 Tax=Clostridium swellfunianum TaxID=1367462 RepID=UPI00202F9386|nr:AAA family ATPase [Clostridium swellfunianum]
MSIIKRLQIKNFLGVEELGLEAAKINIFKGPKGSGKSSIIEGIEKAFTNKDRRTEVIRHGADEATLLIELDNGLEVSRRIRAEKADYLKCRKDNEAVPSTEKFLRSLINGDIFRPLDWVNMGIKEQTKSILSMLEIGWSQENIIRWFGELPSNIDYSQHILQILKAIELKYYNDRQEVNREINELKTQIKVILDELPADYDGEAWRDKKVQEYYSMVNEAQKINHWIEEAKKLQESFEEKVNAIKASADNEKSRVNLKFRGLREDIKDIIDLAKSKIEKAEASIDGLVNTYQTGIKTIELGTQKAKQDLEIELQAKIQELKAEYTERISFVDKKSTEDKEKLKKQLEVTKEESKDLISINENKIASKEQELLGLDDLEKAELKSVEKKIITEIEKEKIRAGKAADYLKNNEPVNLEPLQAAADEVAEMQSYLRQWDMMINIRDGKLAEKERYSNELTSRINTARTLPGELLKTAKMPIDGISVDENGLIRINGTLIDGLSDGEKLELAMRIARAQAGELKVICLDKFESLNPAAQQKLISEMSKDDYQYFVTSTMADEFEIEKIG